LDAGDVALTGNRVTMDTYLSATQGYINHSQTNGYPTRVFFTTGPVDGSSGESGYQRHLKHEHIRSYVRASSDRILFDYADILSWSNAGQQNLQLWTDYGGVSKQYQMIHADNMLNLDGTPHTEDGDHIGPRGALRLGKALWWMLARIAGWDGTPANEPDLAPSSKAASRSSAMQGERITYTVAIRNHSGPISPTVLLTDTIPTGLTYVPGTLQSTAGAPNDSNTSMLRWSGVLSPTPAVTLTFAVTVTTSQPGLITNTAAIAIAGAQPISRTAVVTVNQVIQPDLASSEKTVSRSSARQGERITYTIAVRNQTGPLSLTAFLTDTIPTGLVYVPGTLTTTTGTPNDSNAPTLRWSGVLSPTPNITLTFAVTVTSTQPEAITNAAIIAASGYAPITRIVAVVVNPYQVYLPLVTRNP
jgi:uncharacterized repeat protein (TIGR01451 family)